MAIAYKLPYTGEVFIGLIRQKSIKQWRTAASPAAAS